jgi:hypothetical protein
MRCRRLLVSLMFSPAVLAAQSEVPREAPSPVILQFVRFADIFGSRLVTAFDSIPAARYEFRPTPVQQTIGYIAQHLESANYGLCARLGAPPYVGTAKDSLADTLKARWPKDTLVARLAKSLRYCTAAIEGLRELTSPAVANTLLAFETDLAEHYSQIAVYMRLISLVPPSALPATPRAAITLPTSALQQMVGVYTTTDGLTLEVTLRDGALAVRSLPDGAVVPLRAQSPTEFFITEVDAQLTTTRDTNGSVVGFVVHQYGRDRLARKLR